MFKEPESSIQKALHLFRRSADYAPHNISDAEFKRYMRAKQNHEEYFNKSQEAFYSVRQQKPE